MKNHLLLALLLFTTATAFSQQDEGEKKNIIEKIMGEKAMPDLTLTDINGKKVNVQDYGKSGKLTVMSFWATWCVPCKKELNNVADLYEEWQKKYDMQLVAVSIDDSRSAPRVKPYVDGQRWEYEVLLDVNSDLKRALNILNVPYTLLIDRQGKVVYEHSGYVDGDEFELEKELSKLQKN